MGLFSLIRRWFFPPKMPARSADYNRRGGGIRKRQSQPRIRLTPLRRDTPRPPRQPVDLVETPTPAYRFAQLGVRRGGSYLDLSRDGDSAQLAQFGLPAFDTPEQLAAWLGRPLGQVAWLIHRFSQDHRPEDESSAHYHYHWIKKRSGGWRLIEAPKGTLKAVQTKILREILDKIPPHKNAHGFIADRSIVTNARPHVGSRVLVKFDLENFYATVTFSRVTAIFRSVGYSREAAIWLARLTTSALPPSMPFPNGDASAILPFLPRHLPQGAPTSPALANLSAYSLDVRLSGLARSFDARYTRYADDLTFSGPARLVRALPVFIPLVTQIVRAERFRVHRRKRKVIRNNQRQVVTGVVVNERTNISRREFDRLKAVLANSVRHGPSTQNREARDDFAAYLQGRIAHVAHLHPERGRKLLDLYRRIDWRR